MDTPPLDIYYTMTHPTDYTLQSISINVLKIKKTDPFLFEGSKGLCDWDLVPLTPTISFPEDEKESKATALRLRQLVASDEENQFLALPKRKYHAQDDEIAAKVAAVDINHQSLEFILFIFPPIFSHRERRRTFFSFFLIELLDKRH